MAVAPRPTPAATAAQRRAWSRDRARDAARMLPVLGLALFLLPDLVLSGSAAAEGATRGWVIYLFGAWALLLVFGAVVSRLITRSDDETEVPTQSDQGET